MKKKNNEELKVKWFVSDGPFKDKPGDHGGDYNGYVVVHKSHPFFGIDNDDVPHVGAHGGLTFSRTAKDSKWSPLAEEYKTEDYWIFGFDTLHAGDKRADWPKERVEAETLKLAWEFQKHAIIKKRKENNEENTSTT